MAVALQSYPAMTAVRLALPLLLLGPALGCTATITGDPAPDPSPEQPDDERPAAPDGGACAQVQVTLSPTTPTVQLLVDRSGTMNRDFGTGDRWGAIYSTLMGTGGVVASLQDSVRFGLTTYTGADGVTPCPILNTVSPALTNFAAIETMYGGLDPIEDTPTGPSLDAVRGELALVTETGPKIIVLATDGEPDTCAVPDPDGQPAARAEAIAAAQAAHAAGIDVYIVSVGDEIAASHLQDMANAGVGLPIGGAESAPYYRALAPTELVAAFDQIIDGVRSCSFTLNGSIDPADAASGTVTLDGAALAYGVGWQLTDSQTLELLGDACAAVMSGEHTIEAEFRCGDFDVE